MKLATRLTLVLCGLALALLAAVLFPLYLTQRHRALEELQFRQVAEAQKFARVCADSLASGDETTRVGYLKTLLLFSEAGRIAFALLVDAGGRVLLHSDFLHGDSALRGREVPGLERALEEKDGTRRTILSSSGALELLSTPLYEAGPGGGPGRRAGTAFIAYDRAAMEARVGRARGTLLGDVARAAAPALCLGVILALVFGSTLTRPIQELEAGARLLGEGRRDIRIGAERTDELGALAREFNSMAAKLSELDRLKDSFLAQITHDLGGPLTAIASWVDLLSTETLGPINAKQRSGLRVVLENAEHLNSLIGDILALTRLEAGRHELRPVEVALAPAVESVLELLKSKADEYGIALASTVPAGAVVRADPQALRRVLVNLVSNALKFTPQGGRITVDFAPQGDAGRVSVTDTGIGIPEERLKSLFAKFFQVPETKNQVRESRGTGLGLVICKQLVEAHGGTMGVESAYRKGSTFWFRLPTRSSGSPSPAPSESGPPGAAAASASDC